MSGGAGLLGCDPGLVLPSLFVHRENRDSPISPSIVGATEALPRDLGAGVSRRSWGGERARSCPGRSPASVQVCSFATARDAVARSSARKLEARGNFVPKVITCSPRCSRVQHALCQPRNNTLLSRYQQPERDRAATFCCELGDVRTLS